MELMESSFVSTNFEYYGGIQNLEYEALYQGIISATLLMRGSRQYNSSFTKEGSSSPRPQPPRVSEPQSLNAPQAPALLAPGPQPRPQAPQSPYESGLLEAGDKVLECIRSPSTAGQRVLLTITGSGIMINFKQSSRLKEDDVL